MTDNKKFNLEEITKHQEEEQEEENEFFEDLIEKSPQITSKEAEEKMKEKKEKDKMPPTTDDECRKKFIKNKDAKEKVNIIAEYLVKKYHIKTIPDARRDFFYLYGNGFYTQVDEADLRNKAEKILDKLLNNHITNEIIGKIKRETHCLREDIESKDLNLICVNNGILNMETLELKDHTPNIFFFKKIPVDYNPEAECSTIMKFIGEVVDETNIPLVQEWFGYPLYREYFLKKALIIYGEQDTGKTTLMNLLIKFIGESNVSGLALQDLEREKFRMIKLYQQLLNMKDDLSSYDIKFTGALKMATGRSQITAQRKFGDEFEFTNFAKMVFAANKIPSTKEIDDDAYYSRWIIIEFNKTFGGNKEDPNLSKKLQTPEELSGLLNWALIGLKRLREVNKFSFDLSVEEVKQLMIRSSSLVADFIHEELEEATGEYVTKEDMYMAFQKYSRKAKIPVITKEMLGRRIIKYSTFIEEGRTKIKGKQVMVWMNIKMKNSLSKTEEKEIPERTPEEINRRLELEN